MLDFRSIKFFKQAVNASSYKETPSDISCRCPICGDSKYKKNSKRLHLYKKGNVEQINCFNAGCSCVNKTVYSFLRDFYPSLLPQYKRETFQSKMETLKSTRINEFNFGDLKNSDIAKLDTSDAMGNSVCKSNIIYTSDIVDKPNYKENKSTGNSNNKENEFNFEDLKNSDIAKLDNSNIKPEVTLFDLYPFLEDIDSEMEKYILDRGLEPNFKGKWFKGKTNIKINDITYYIKGFLVIPLFFNDKMYGFYSRDIKKKTFITFISTTGYKVWNWFGIDRTKPVYIFEAIFDAQSTGKENIIANLGAKIPNERLKELKEPIFCLDNDTTGIKMSIDYAKQGHKVYIQPDIYKEKDFNELKLNHPDINISELIDNNIFSGMSAITRLKMKL